jgi:nucleoside-diphosphate-sugar epimerase
MSGVNLITGGSGYFGSLLLRKLRERGEPCRVFDLNDANDRPPEVPYIRGDVSDLESVRRACAGVEVIHHNVAQVPLARHRHLFESVNVRGTENVLRAALEANVRKVVYTSSSAVYGVPERNPVTEETPPRPAEPYGRSKLEGERLCRQYAERGLDVTIIRPRTILGHGRLGIFQVLFEWVRQGALIPVLGRGDNLYQFVHADDLAEACLLAGQAAGPDTFNCGAEHFGTMRQGLEALCRHAGTGATVRGVPMRPAIWAMTLTTALGLSPLGPYHALMYGRSLYFDIRKATRVLGWRPRYANDQMLCESYDWYLANRAAVLASSGSHHRSAVKQGALRLLRWWR